MPLRLPPLSRPVAARAGDSPHGDTRLPAACVAFVVPPSTEASSTLVLAPCSASAAKPMPATPANADRTGTTQPPLTRPPPPAPTDLFDLLLLLLSQRDSCGLCWLALVVVTVVDPVPAVVTAPGVVRVVGGWLGVVLLVI